MLEAGMSRPGEIRGGTHIVMPPGGGPMSIFHDGDLDPRIPGMEVVDSFKVTEVDWDKDTGWWVSKLKDGTEICRAETKKGVVAMEHEILAQMEAEGTLFPRGQDYSKEHQNE